MLPDKITDTLKRLTDRLFVRPLSLGARIGQMFAIKYLYLILALLVLKNGWYVGYGSYGIDFSLWKELLAAPVFLGMTLLHLRCEAKPFFPKTLVHILFVMYYIPLNCAFSLNNRSFVFFFLSHLYFALVIVCVFFLSRFLEGRLDHLRPGSIPPKRSLLGDPGLNRLFFVLCCLFILYKLCYNGLSFSVSIDSSDVYENRSEYQSFLDAISGTSFAYVISLLSKVISYAAPFYLLSSLMRKKYLGAGVALLTILSSYAISSGKSTLFFIAIALCVYALSKWKLCRHFNRIFDLGILALLGVCLAEHFLLQSDRIFTVILRRQMYLPAWLNTMYYDYFMTNGAVWWSQNTFVLQSLIPDVYDTSPLTIISNVYFQGQVPSPNTGMMAEAVMHAGLLGIFLYPPALALLSVLSGKILKQYGPAAQLLVAAKLALSLINVPITRTDFVLSCVAFLFLLLAMPFFTPGAKAFLAFTRRVRQDLEDEENSPRDAGSDF